MSRVKIENSHVSDPSMLLSFESLLYTFHSIRYKLR